VRLEEIESGDALHQAVLDAIARGDANAINEKRALQEWLLFYAPELIAAATAAAWRPIETAPRDETQILACECKPKHLSDKGYTSDVSIVRWSGNDWVAMADGYEAIRSEGDTWTDYHEPFVTHWRPIGPLPGEG
jgi:hypothetical protein